MGYPILLVLFCLLWMIVIGVVLIALYSKELRLLLRLLYYSYREPDRPLNDEEVEKLKQMTGLDIPQGATINQVNELAKVRED